MKSFTTLALIALLPSAFAASITATNKCKNSVWVKPDAQGFSGAISEIKTGATWTSPFETTKFGNAVKFSNSKTDFSKPISFDYSVSAGLTYYDVSDAAGSPFKLTARDTTGGGQTCPDVGCPGTACKAVKACDSSHVYAIQAC
jgi:hypothetical protein